MLLLERHFFMKVKCPPSPFFNIYKVGCDLWVRVVVIRRGFPPDKLLTNIAWRRKPVNSQMKTWSPGRQLIIFNYLQLSFGPNGANLLLFLLQVSCVSCIADILYCWANGERCGLWECRRASGSGLKGIRAQTATEIKLYSLTEESSRAFH